MSVNVDNFTHLYRCANSLTNGSFVTDDKARHYSGAGVELSVEIGSDYCGGLGAPMSFLSTPSLSQRKWIVANYSCMTERNLAAIKLSQYSIIRSSFDHSIFNDTFSPSLLRGSAEHYCMIMIMYVERTRGCTRE